MAKKCYLQTYREVPLRLPSRYLDISFISIIFCFLLFSPFRLPVYLLVSELRYYGLSHKINGILPRDIFSLKISSWTKCKSTKLGLPTVYM